MLFDFFRYILAFGANGESLSFGTAAPTNAYTDYIKGSLHINSDPSNGEPFAWLCTVSGAPGTWVSLARLDIDGSATWDPGSLADGAGETSSAITATGAALGDFVLVSAPYDLQGITATGYVSAANAVKIRLQNETGGTIDLASGTWRVRVIKV